MYSDLETDIYWSQEVDLVEAIKAGLRTVA